MEVPTPPILSQGHPYKSHISVSLAHVSVQVEAEQRLRLMNHDLEQRHLLLVCWQHFAVLLLVLALDLEKVPSQCQALVLEVVPSQALVLEVEEASELVMVCPSCVFGSRVLLWVERLELAA